MAQTNFHNGFFTSRLPVILIADDEQVYLEVISQALEGEYEIIYAPNGKIALDIAEKESPDLIIMDWDMPIMSGIDAIKTLKTQRQTVDIPIIMCTGAMTSVEFLKEALDAGANDFIHKPVDPIELVARINTALQLSSSYQQIKQQKEKLEELNHEKDSILGVVAHDLTSPLSKIDAIAQMLQEFDLTEKEKDDFYVKILNEVKNGTSLINDLLMVTKTEFGMTPFQYATVSLNDIFDQLELFYKKEAEKKNIKLHCKLEEQVSFRSDPIHFRRIMDNLLTNALKFSPSYTEVKVHAQMQEKQLKIQVIDQGPGIRKEELPKLFKRFAKISNAPTAGEHSTGLGMAIIKSLCDRLKIEIEVDSERGKGTTICLYIPK